MSEFASSGKKNIAVIYDERSTFTKTVMEHVAAFKEYSRHNIFFLPGTNQGWPTTQSYTSGWMKSSSKKSKWSLQYFDVLIVHYSVRMSYPGYVSEVISDAVHKFTGPKVLFIQDEYENVNEAIRNIDHLGFDVIYTCVPPEGISYVYGQLKNKNTRFIRNLTGYVPFVDSVEKHSLPLEERKVLVGYRGRRLPHHYGMLGFDKFDIGERFKQRSISAGLVVDIETSDSKRIYEGWYDFIGSCRATLGTPSGANIFDFDGSLKEKAINLQEFLFEDVYQEHFERHEGQVIMDQISPKFFEAILMRTALICYPGDYSGILIPDVHFIALERDFSNFDDVVEKLTDLSYLTALTDRAYRDIISTGLNSYKHFMAGVDDLIDTLAPRRKVEIISTPIGYLTGRQFTPFGHPDASDFLINDIVLSGDLHRENFVSFYEPQGQDNSNVKWNCLKLRDGASIRRSSKFHPAPHDAGSLLVAHKHGSYAACVEGYPLPHFIEMDLGSRRTLSGFLIEWLSNENLGTDFVVQLSVNGLFWKEVIKVSENGSTNCEYVIKPQLARFVKLIVKGTLGQQRLLMKKFEVYASNRQS